MKAVCPICNRTGDYDSSQEGKMIPCSDCGNLFVLKNTQLHVECPECGQTVEPDVRICIECSYNFDSGKKVPNPNISRKRQQNILIALKSDLNLIVCI